MSKWKHKGGVRVDAYEKESNAGAIIGWLIVGFIVIAVLNS